MRKKNTRFSEKTARLIEHIEGLSQANILTGFWDNKRNEMRRQFETLPSSVLFGTFVHTEKESRKSCERRAYHRGQIDTLIKELIDG